MPENDSRYGLEQELKDIETYLERVEREPRLYPVEFILHKRARRDEIKRILSK